MGKDTVKKDLSLKDVKPTGQLTMRGLEPIDPSISFHFQTEPSKEIIRFTNDKMYLHGEETDCPQDIIDGMRIWLDQEGMLQTIEKARKYDEIINLIDKQDE